ncbi:unnamed protein product [Rotaria socialis]
MCNLRTTENRAILQKSPVLEIYRIHRQRISVRKSKGSLIESCRLPLLERIIGGYTMYRAGHRKYSLAVNNNRIPASFSYTEKGIRREGKPTIVFVHGIASYKEGWMSIVKNISADHHCITLDLPGHGQTIGLNEDVYTIDKFVEKLRMFFDEMELTEPMCIIGASMGSAIVCMFAVKYPGYVSMICLLAPIADKESETELIHQLRAGVYHGLLPETPHQLRQIINDLTVKRPYVPRPMLNGLLHIKLRLLEEHKKILASIFEHDYPKLEQEYEKLRNLTCPVLVLWGRQDKVYSCTGVDLFRKLIRNLEYVIFEDCGHDMDVDQPEQTAGEILRFYDKHWNTPKNQTVQNDRDNSIYRMYPNYNAGHPTSLSVNEINGIIVSSDF